MNDESMIKNRDLPPLSAVVPDATHLTWLEIQQQVRQYFQAHEYGVCSPGLVTTETTWLSTVVMTTQTTRQYQLKFTFATGQIVAFPFRCSEPSTPGPHPVIVWLDFGKQLPLREATDMLVAQGFAVVSLTHNAVTKDQADASGIAAVAGPNSGKLAMWAWAASKVMDHIVASGRFDLEKTAIVGHSRLGKTALLAGLLDPRFKVVVANASGCCGASLFRGSTGESIAHIQTEFPYWFSPEFLQSASMPAYDQHLLLAAIAPRVVYLTCAASDQYSDQLAEHLALKAAAKVAFDQHVEAPFGFHLRPGKHALTMTDWQAIVTFLNQRFAEVRE